MTAALICASIFLAVALLWALKDQIFWREEALRLKDKMLSATEETGTLRAELIAKRQDVGYYRKEFENMRDRYLLKELDVRTVAADRDSWKQRFEQMHAETEHITTAQPAGSIPRGIRWSGPGGARQKAELAAQADPRNNQTKESA